MDKRKLALAAGGLFLSFLCTQSAPATADDEGIPTFIIKQSPELLLNPNSKELTDFRYSSPDGMNVLYDEKCMMNHDLKLVFYQRNKEQLVLEYFPAPATSLPNGQKAEVKCPTIESLASQIAQDSSWQYQFMNDRTLIALSAPDVSLTSMASNAVTSLRYRAYRTLDGKLKTQDLFDQRHAQIGYGHRLDDGGYEVTAYFANMTVAHHRVTNKQGAVIAEEVNAPGGFPLTKTVTDKEKTETSTFDSEQHVLMYHDLRFPDGKQSTREVYYSGTDKLRMRVKYDGSKTIADFFRQSDGTLERTQTVDPYNATVRYMDATGTIPLYEQVWKFTNTGKGRATDYIMSSMSELNAKGEEVKRFDVSEDHKYIAQEARRNITVGAMTYPTVYYKYRDDATLGEVQYVTPGSLPNPPPEPHKASESIKLVVDIKELKHPDFDDLPIPQQINMGFGGH